MRRIFSASVVLLAIVWAPSALAGGWTASVPFTNQVASSPTPGWGYPDPSGAPTPGTCTGGSFNSNRSESWLAVKPGTENLVGSSKFFFDRYSTFYNFYLGAYTIENGNPSGNVGIPGYDCVTTGTQAMPPSWTNATDPNVAFDTQGRAYSVTLPFNAYWTNLHPNGAIGAVYSDDIGKTWHPANGGKYLELLNNQSSFSFGAFEDKQWVAVNDAPYSLFRDHVYAMWAIFNGNTIKLMESVSWDRGLTFSAPIQISVPSQTGPATTYVYPSVDAAGDLYVSLAAFPSSGGADADMYVTHSSNDGQTFAPWTFVARAHGVPGTEDFANGNFRDGILENFAASSTYAGHAYVTYEDWDAVTSSMDVKLSYTTDGGRTWSLPATVNDQATVLDGTDQFQPSVAEGPNGAVAVAFYDRRQACGKGASIAQTGKANACIDVSLQAYKDNGSGLSKVGSNARITQYQWDPSEPVQKVGGIGQAACSGVDDPCSEIFIGDYFGLAISQGNIYALFVSTHYPATVGADGGGRVYYQQQVLATVSRGAYGSGY